jgi:hypothetical protein
VAGRVSHKTEQMEEVIMNKLKELVVTVKAKIDVDESTANACLKLVEMYVNAKDVKIVVDRMPNGEEVFRYEPN